MIEAKTPAQVELMRVAGLVVGHTLAVLRAAAQPGVSTRDLDDLAEREIRGAGAVPSFKGYRGFPASICASVNDEIVHGIPGERVLRDGDVVSIDCGAIVDGWHGDAAVTVAVGDVRPELLALMTACEDALWAGLAAAVPGARLGDISHAVQSSAQPRAGRFPTLRQGTPRTGRYGLVRDYVGHGIGRQMHEDPEVPNHGRAGRGPRLREGFVLAVEPMLTLGDRRTRVLADGWTVVTADGSAAAHFEHTVAVTADGPRVLTALDGGRGRLGRPEAASTTAEGASGSAAPAAGDSPSSPRVG